MKKIFALITAATMIFAGTTPANADVTTNNPPSNMTSALWSFSVTGEASISVTGSIVEGQTYQVVGNASCAASDTYTFTYEPDDGLPDRTYTAPVSNRGPLNLSNSSMTTLSQSPSWSTTAVVPDPGTTVWSGPLISGAAGTKASYVVSTLCGYWMRDGSASWPKEIRSEIITITFESAPAVGSPINFSVFPQAAGTAFATWGIANGATSYTVSAGGRSCTTTENFCTITGLTAGSSYVFSVVATNGSATSPAVTSESIVLRQPVSVALGLNGGTWRVGETVSAQYVVQGSIATPTITWHHCDSAVFAMPTPPVGNCSVVGSGASYVLSSGDVGKFVTANVFVNNTDPQGQMTASSNQAVLASGAVAPPAVADPAGKPTIVNIPNPIVSVAGGTQVTITGTGLAGVTSVTVGGVPALVVSKTDTTVVVQMPNSTKVGLADLTVTNAQGSVTSKSAIVYTTNPVIKITKTRTLTGFTATQKALSNSQKTAVRTLLTANPTLTELTCAARTTGVAASKTALAGARTLATATCAYAKSLKATLVTKTSAAQTLPKAKASRTVLLTLKN